MADGVDTLGVDLRTRVKKLGAKEKSEKKKVQGEVLDYHEEQGLPEELHESGCQEVATCRHDASKDMESPCGRDVSPEEVETEETDGGGSWQEEYNLVVPVHGGTWPGGGR